MKRPNNLIERLKHGELDPREQENLFKYIKELEIYKYKYEKLKEVVEGLEKQQNG